MDLEGKTCLVTGANRGIGLAIAQRLAQSGAHVLAGVRDLDRYTPIDGATPVLVDLSDRATLDACVRELDLGAIDVLVNNAGQFVGGQLEHQDPDAIEAVLQATLLGTIRLTRHVLPHMLERGSGKIVNNASIAAYVNFPGVSTYCAAKAGVSAFTESLRRELHDTPVTTLHVITGGIETDMLDETREDVGDQLPGAENWDQHTPDEWADTIVEAIAKDKNVLGPGGSAALGKLASHLPPFVLDTALERAFTRR